ncbi:hypothetical protein LTR09_008484 [Extremus antarcticus]|uniref:Uncharacterized protein n=1 Tax=Extremus antarcticus TaxID=702011 RepID=A0AAJ0GCE6_9PEZI|nr:hypothetical protein LTR09_008484 [Extremus antarcticus]
MSIHGNATDSAYDAEMDTDTEARPTPSKVKRSTLARPQSRALHSRSMLGSQTAPTANSLPTAGQQQSPSAYSSGRRNSSYDDSTGPDAASRVEKADSTAVLRAKAKLAHLQSSKDLMRARHADDERMMADAIEKAKGSVEEAKSGEKDEEGVGEGDSGETALYIGGYDHTKDSTYRDERSLLFE